MAKAKMRSPDLCTIHLSMVSPSILANAQEVAADLGYVSTTGKTKGRGSLSQLVAAIGNYEVVIRKLWSVEVHHSLPTESQESP